MSKATRGEIWQTMFSPNLGAEIGKARPAVVLNSPKAGRLALSIVVPITDWKDHYGDYFWFVRLEPSGINGLSKESRADAFQVKSLADERLLRRLGTLDREAIQEIAFAVGFCIGI